MNKVFFHFDYLKWVQMILTVNVHTFNYCILFYAFTETPQSSYWERQVKSQNLINSILGFLLIFNGKYIISFSSINLFDQIDC